MANLTYSDQHFLEALVVDAAAAGVTAADIVTVTSGGTTASEVTVVNVDTEGASTSPAADNKTLFDSIIASAPAVGSGSLLRVQFGANQYVTSSLAAFQDKNIELRGVYGKTTPDGTSNGTSLLAKNNGDTIMTVGDGSNIYQNGPMISDINFKSNGKTGVTGLLWRSTNHGRLYRLSGYQLKYGMIFRRDVGLDCAWNDVYDLSFYQHGVLETAGDARAIWMDGGSATKFFAGELLIKQSVTSGTNYGIYVSDDTAAGSATGANANKFFGTKIESSARTDRTVGIYCNVAKANEFHGMQLEALGTGAQFGGNHPTGSYGRGNFLLGGEMANIATAVQFDAGASASGFDLVTLDPVITTTVSDASAGQNFCGRFLGLAQSAAAGSAGSDKPNVQSGTSYSPTFAQAMGDRFRGVAFSNAAAVAFTMPAGLPVGTEMPVFQYGAGTVTTAVTGETVRGAATTSAQYTWRTYKKVNSTEWIGQ